MTAEQCRTELAKLGFGRLACARDNQPYIVPIYFAMEDDGLYSFARPGQKVDWMRENPRVCVEADSVHNGSDWLSIVALGSYEELTDTPEHYNQRLKALELLQHRPMWWEPGAIVPNPNDGRGHSNIFYRISLHQLSGYRGVRSV